ncbi:hypothetical protein B0H16DRAFT_984576 [Mycena metata]|uniref:Nephrocystin 3-like N-terminal domain-containing protein n=1 Tax=Mycena metata TaxID=1033252 RepID=A0AAD7ILE6_9AGAR|nr:hypothetical protein B0H16DRAFT_984576 [Mycena metata]
MAHPDFVRQPEFEHAFDCSTMDEHTFGPYIGSASNRALDDRANFEHTFNNDARRGQNFLAQPSQWPLPPSSELSLESPGPTPYASQPLREADPPVVYSESPSQQILSSAGNPTSDHNIHATNRSILPHFASHPFPGATNDLPFPWDRPFEAPVTSINGGTFIGGDLNHIQRPRETGLHILHRAIAGDAFHDSAERYPQPRCHPNTRLRMLDMLGNWAHGNGLPKNWITEDYDPSSQDPEFCEDQGRFLWLHGPAGSGKSAIAQSFCQKLRAEGLLGGSFFFKRGNPSRGNGNKLFPTIAYQLATLFPSFNRFISQRMESDPAIVDRSLVTQLQSLIVEPCQNSTPPQPVIIVIDGLDECEGHNIQQAILQSIAHVMHEEHISLRFFVTSRPEAHITEVFQEAALEKFHHSLFINQSFEDVRKYLEDEFNRIRQEHRFTMATITTSWPSPEIIEGLVENSSGYFIYAATVIRFIDDKNFRLTDRLETVLGIKECGFESPFDPLDQLYLQILSLVPLDSRSQLLRILTIIAARLLLHPFHVEQLLKLRMGDCHLILRGLHSIISVPEEGADVDFVCAEYHASFSDFLNNPTRSGAFFVGGTQQRMDLAGHILNALSYKNSDYPLPPQYAGRHVAWGLDLAGQRYLTLSSLLQNLFLSSNL